MYRSSTVNCLLLQTCHSLKTLSVKARSLSHDVIEHIKHIPFIEELISGKLPYNKFKYYIQQDIIYLHVYANCLKYIIPKVPSEYKELFVYDYNSTLDEKTKEINILNDTTTHITYATFSYIHYISDTCYNDTLENIVAMLLPCTWVYYELIKFFHHQNISEDNPYYNWFMHNDMKSFKHSVMLMFNIFDELGNKASPDTQQNMVNIFYAGVELERNFFNDAYNMDQFQNITEIYGDNSDFITLI